MPKNISDYFDLSQTEYAKLFDDITYIWDAIHQITPYIQSQFATDRKPNITTIDLPDGVRYGSPDIYIGQDVRFEPDVFIKGPAIIDDGAFIGHGAFIRDYVLIGKGAVVGHSTEVKHAVFMEKAGAPHFTYVGDSILGQRVNLGAGAKLSNFPVKFMNVDPLPTIHITVNDEVIDTELSKFGAILGDDVNLGCNSVTNPGVVVGARTWIYPLASLSKGIYPPDTVIKLRQTLEMSPKHE